MDIGNYTAFPTAPAYVENPGNHPKPKDSAPSKAAPRTLVLDQPVATAVPYLPTTTAMSKRQGPCAPVPIPYRFLQRSAQRKHDEENGPGKTPLRRSKPRISARAPTTPPWQGAQCVPTKQLLPHGLVSKTRFPLMTCPTVVPSAWGPVTAFHFHHPLKPEPVLRWSSSLSLSPPA